MRSENCDIKITDFSASTYNKEFLCNIEIQGKNIIMCVIPVNDCQTKLEKMIFISGKKYKKSKLTSKSERLEIVVNKKEDFEDILNFFKQLYSDINIKIRQRILIDNLYEYGVEYIRERVLRIKEDYED